MAQLTKTELAALDLLIAHAEDSGQTYDVPEPESFIGGIVHALKKVVPVVVKVAPVAVDVLTATVGAAAEDFGKGEGNIDANTLEQLKKLRASVNG